MEAETLNRDIESVVDVLATWGALYESGPDGEVLRSLEQLSQAEELTETTVGREEVRSLAGFFGRAESAGFLNGSPALAGLVRSFREEAAGPDRTSWTELAEEGRGLAEKLGGIVDAALQELIQRLMTAAGTDPRLLDRDLFARLVRSLPGLRIARAGTDGGRKLDACEEAERLRSELDRLQPYWLEELRKVRKEVEDLPAESRQLFSSLPPEPPDPNDVAAIADLVSRHRHVLRGVRERQHQQAVEAARAELSDAMQRLAETAAAENAFLPASVRTEIENALEEAGTVRTGSSPAAMAQWAETLGTTGREVAAFAAEARNRTESRIESLRDRLTGLIPVLESIGAGDTLPAVREAIRNLESAAGADRDQAALAATAALDRSEARIGKWRNDRTREAAGALEDLDGRIRARTADASWKTLLEARQLAAGAGSGAHLESDGAFQDFLATVKSVAGRLEEEGRQAEARRRRQDAAVVQELEREFKKIAPFLADKDRSRFRQRMTALGKGGDGGGNAAKLLGELTQVGMVAERDLREAAVRDLNAWNRAAAKTGGKPPRLSEAECQTGSRGAAALEAALAEESLEQVRSGSSELRPILARLRKGARVRMAAMAAAVILMALGGLSWVYLSGRPQRVEIPLAGPNGEAIRVDNGTARLVDGNRDLGRLVLVRDGRIVEGSPAGNGWSLGEGEYEVHLQSGEDSWYLGRIRVPPPGGGYPTLQVPVPGSG